MRALTIRQPWATLIALGVKTIETRSWRAPASLIGQHFAIHAGMHRPVDDVGDYQAIGCGFSGWWLRHRPSWDERRAGAGTDADPASLLAVLSPEQYRDWWTAPLPLGAIVATARIVDCVPITDRRYMPDHGPQVTINPATGTLRRIGSPLSGIFDDVTDQLPYGDFTPGRWAWLLDDAKLTTERCPECMGRAFACGHERHRMSLGCICTTCDGAGTCPPIPAKGRQGLWRWEP